MAGSSFIWASFLPTGLVCNLATLGPLGRIKPGPGTVGTVAGIFWYTVVFSNAGPLGWLIGLAVSLYVAIAICGEAEIRLGKRDPGEVILDEFVAVPICFLGLHPSTYAIHSLLLLVLGFGLFRLFDIVKPFGINRLQAHPGGYGVVADDVAAALATCVCLHVINYLLTLWVQ